MGAYSRILLPWDSQPQEAVGVDWENPLTQGLYTAANFTTTRPQNAVSGALSTGSTIAPAMQPQPFGLGAFFSNGSTVYVDVPGSRGNLGSGSLSIAVGFRQTSVAGVGPRLIDNTDADNTAPSLQFTGGTSWTYYCKSNSVGGHVSMATGAAVNTDQHFLITIDRGITDLNGGRLKWYVNGSPQTVTVGANGNGDIVDTNTRVGGIQVAPRSADSVIYYFYKFNRVLSALEARLLAANPYQLFAPRSIWVPVSASAPAPSPTRSIVEVKVPWDSQPQDAVEVNPDLQTGLLAAFNGAQISRLANGFPATLVGSIGSGVTPRGLGYQGDGTGKYAYYDNPSISTSALTILAVVYDGTTGTADRRALSVADRANANNYLAIGRGSTAAAKARVLAVVDGSAGTSTVETTRNVFDGQVHAIALRWTRGVGTQSFVDGSIDAFAANTTAANINATGTTVCALGRSTFATFYGGAVLLGASWARGLSDQECAELTANPWSLFAPRSIWVPVSAGASGAIDLTVDDAAHAHTADSPTLTVNTSTDLTTQDATHAHTADSPTLTLDTTLTVDEALHAHTADNLTVSTTGAVNLVIDDATHAHTADALALTLDTTLAVADAAHAHTADNLTISTSGAVNLTVDDAPHAHTADSPTLTLGYVDLVIAEALHAHTADSPTLSVVEYTDLIIARAVHAHTVDNLTLTFPLGALSDAEFREMYDWVKELHRIHGLTSGVDLVVTPTSRTAGAISQTISEVGTTVTVTRP